VTWLLQIPQQDTVYAGSRKGCKYASLSPNYEDRDIGTTYAINCSDRRC